MDKKEQLDPRKIQVHTPEHLRGGVYANLTNVNVTKNELVLNFVFANENDTPNGTLVARVVVSREHARDLLRVLKDSVTIADEVDPTS